MQYLKTDKDFHTSVERALDEIDPGWRAYEGLLVSGSHSPEEVEGKIGAIRFARENRMPFLGICFGMQLMLIEFARNVLGLKKANSEEVDLKTPHPIFIKMPALRVGIKPVEWEGKVTDESHWHNYKFNPKYYLNFIKHWDISMTQGILEVAKLKDYTFFMGVQFHPEYNSSLNRPHSLLIQFLKRCKNR